uniref:Tumor suppressor 2, mitochondrial calcium regulator a n=1 Tax=Cyprinus carpio TaxID=7962 RepID=A0A8C1KEV7_CYPCA
MEKRDEPQVDGKRGGSHAPYAAYNGCDKLLAHHASLNIIIKILYKHSLYFDEDGDLAHEFYEETVVTKNGRKKAKLKRIQKNLIPQGIIKLDHPRIRVDFPVILCEI